MRITAALLPFALLASPCLAQSADDIERAHAICMRHADIRGLGIGGRVSSMWAPGFEKCADIQERWLKSSVGKEQQERTQREQDDEKFLGGFK